MSLGRSVSMLHLQLSQFEGWKPAILQLARQFCTGEASVKQLSATSSLLRNLRNGAEVYVIGTAHVSSKSAKEVREMISVVQPNAVMLELCKTRLEKLRGSDQSAPGFLKTVLSQLGMPGSIQSRLLGAGLSGMYATLRAVGLEPGAEFKAGIEEAERIGAKIVCGDQEQHITAQRIAQHFKWQDLMQLMGPPANQPDLFNKFPGSLEDMVEMMKTREAANQMSDYLRGVNPNVARALIDERDEVLAKSLLEQEGRVVGVVGLAHLEGIEKIWRANMS